MTQAFHDLATAAAGVQPPGTETYAVTARYPPSPRDQAAPPRFATSGQSTRRGLPANQHGAVPRAGGQRPASAVNPYHQRLRAAIPWPAATPSAAAANADADPYAVPRLSRRRRLTGRAAPMAVTALGAYPQGVTWNLPGRAREHRTHSTGGYPPRLSVRATAPSRRCYPTTDRYPDNDAYHPTGGYPARAYPAGVPVLPGRRCGAGSFPRPAQPRAALRPSPLRLPPLRPNLIDSYATQRRSDVNEPVTPSHRRCHSVYLG